MSRYAADTRVSSDQSIMEIRRTLTRYGAGAFMFAEDDEAHKAIISFKLREKFFKLSVPLPDRKARDITHTPSRGQLRSIEAQEAAYEQAVKQRWRAIALLVKALLEANESGLEALVELLLQSLILLPDGSTVGEWMQPQIDRAYLEGTMPHFLPMLEHKEE
jgi:hypothetical protein